MRRRRPEQEAHVDPPKKRKFESLLPEVENKNLVRLKDLVNNGADVQSTGNFSWNNLDFEDIPPMFAAMISGQGDMIDFLAKHHPHFSIKKKEAQKRLTNLIFLIPTS